MIVLAAPEVFLHCDWSNSKPPHCTAHSWCIPRRAAFLGAGTGTTMVWVNVSEWGGIAVFFNSCFTLKQVRDTYWSVGSRRGVLPKWVYRRFQQSSLCLRCAMARYTPIPGCFLIGMAVQTVSMIPQLSFPLAMLQAFALWLGERTVYFLILNSLFCLKTAHRMFLKKFRKMGMVDSIIYTRGN